jgi:poly-gamma-glutamate synthesis protein (capsule biosynthesis protein)
LKSTTVAFIGDIIFRARASAAAIAGRPDLVWGDVLPVMQGADAVFANMENPITRSRQRWRRSFKPVVHRSEPETINLLTAANIAFVNLANNHALDYEVDGLLETIGLLQGAGIAHAGAGRDLEAASRPALVEVGGMTFGAIGLTDNTPAFAAGPDRAGTNYMRIASDPVTMARIAGQVKALRASGAQVVVLSVHWGPNLRAWPPARFRRFAHAAIEAGVDVFHGHSAHLLQGVERYRDGLILYDTGDIIDDAWWFVGLMRYFLGALFLVDFEDGRVRDLRVVPLVMGPGSVRLAQGTLARRVIARLARRSPPGGRRVTGGGEIDLPFRYEPLAGITGAAGP